MKLHSENANKILALYYKRVHQIIKPLADADRQEITMELTSHIYESMARNPQGDEATTLLQALEKLGEPDTFLYDVVAERKLRQARKTFNPIHLASALALNIGRGFAKGILFFVVGVVYIISFACGGVALLKPFFPNKIGLYTNSNGLFAAGWITDIAPGTTEWLGLWFTPVFIILAVLLYVINTLLLKLIPTTKTTI
jgi:hypothetical protein